MNDDVLAWRGEFGTEELNALLRDAWGQQRDDERDPGARLKRYSLGWVTARDVDGTLIGFVNVAWDGGIHAFLLDTTVASATRRRDLGTRLVREATVRASAAGCQHIHVDFEPHLAAFYLQACGFDPTDAGLM